MKEFKSKVIIDGQEYTDDQLRRFENTRTLHALHEMKQLGLEMRDGDHEISHEDLNWMDPKEAEKLLLDLRVQLGEDGILKLFDGPEKDAERRWKQYAADYVPSEAHVGVTEVSIEGVDIPSTMAVLGGAQDTRQALATFPEHYIVIGDIKSGQRGMEVFGMFGEPIYVHGTTSQEIPEGLPVKKDDTYPMKIFGEMLLKRDDTPIHVGAYHQFRPTPNGFDVKSTFFCPGKAPAAIADGHKLHFAIEIVNSARTAFANQNVEEEE